MLVDFADLLPGAKLTADLVFDPRSFCGDETFARLDRAKRLIHLQLHQISSRDVEALGKFCVNSTRIDPEQ